LDISQFYNLGKSSSVSVELLSVMVTHVTSLSNTLFDEHVKFLLTRVLRNPFLQMVENVNMEDLSHLLSSMEDCLRYFTEGTICRPCKGCLLKASGFSEGEKAILRSFPLSKDSLFLPREEKTRLHGTSLSNNLLRLSPSIENLTKDFQ